MSVGWLLDWCRCMRRLWMNVRHTTIELETQHNGSVFGTSFKYIKSKFDFALRIPCHVYIVRILHYLESIPYYTMCFKQHWMVNKRKNERKRASETKTIKMEYFVPVLCAVCVRPTIAIAATTKIYLFVLYQKF